jgi:hypothetical protein
MQHAIFSNLQGGLRTGNPLVDAVLATALFAALTFFVEHAKKGGGALWRLLTGRWWTWDACPDSELSVPLRADTYFNADYDALVWYLSVHAPVTKGAAIVMRANKSNSQPVSVVTVLPEKKQAVEISFEGRRLSYMRQFEMADADSGKCKNRISDRINERIVLTLHGPDLDGVQVLLRLMAVVREAHDVHERTIKWNQKLFRLRSGPLEGFASWTGTPTHSTKSFRTVVLDATTKDDLVSDVRTFLDGERWYAEMGLSYKRGYLLHGPPGTGKSSVVLAIAGMAAYDIYAIDLAALENDAALDEAFAKMPDRCVVVFEDIDCMGTVAHARDARDATGCVETSEVIRKTNKKAGRSGSSDATDCDGDGCGGVTLSCLLNHLDGVGANHGRIFVMTTNHVELLDPALIRPGRADLHLRMGLCSREQIRLFFELFYPGKTPPPSVATLPDNTFSPAEVSSTMLHHREDPARAAATLQAKLTTFF